nr:MAG TPA: Head fiber protein [Caudoviricetes sp.]
MAFLDLDGLSHLVQWFKGQLGGKVDKVEGKQLSTNDYTTAEKNKLAGLSNYSHPTTSGNKHIPAGGAAGKILGWASDGTAQWVDDKNTTYNDVTQSAHGLMTAADKTKLDGIAAGANKYIHPSYTAAAAGLYKVTVDANGHVSATTAVAKSDITALGIPSTNTTYSAATQSANGLMSAADKKKLDGFGAASSYATMTYVGQQISAAGHISKSIVETLPAVKDAKDNVIYMIKKATPDGSNLYDEYMLISGALEKIGDTKTIIEAITNTQIDTILAS